MELARLAKVKAELEAQKRLLDEYTAKATMQTPLPVCSLSISELTALFMSGHNHLLCIVAIPSGWGQ